MAQRKRRRLDGKRRAGTSRRGQPNARRGDPFGVNDLGTEALKSATELLTIDDPLEAEDWASSLLGVFYKPQAPLEAREAIERGLLPALIRAAEKKRNAAGLASLCALAAVTDDASGAREAADRMVAHGLPRPRWAAVAGHPEYLGGYAIADPFGDQIAYYLTFQYEGRSPHVLMALYDENLGGIIKDAFVGELREGADPRSLADADPDIDLRDVDPAEASLRIQHAVATGDLYLDNHWTQEFRNTRALLLARVRLLPQPDARERSDALGIEPCDEEQQEALAQEFLASPLAPPRDETLAIVDHCLIARCEFGDGDPLRWSPTVVELFMLDYLPRKVNLTDAELDALPEVLTAWVRFALGMRGLEERFIIETEEAVRRFTPEFKQAANDPARFGPAKAFARAMRDAGADITDSNAVDAWMNKFNALPQSERDRLLGLED